MTEMNQLKFMGADIVKLDRFRSRINWILFNYVDLSVKDIVAIINDANNEYYGEPDEKG